MMYSLNVRNPFELDTMLYSSTDKCMSELVRQANRAITEKLSENQLIELRKFKKIRKNSKNIDDILNLSSISKLLNTPTQCSLFYRMIVQISKK